jgi:hypothetical protein
LRKALLTFIALSLLTPATRTLAEQKPPVLKEESFKAVSELRRQLADPKIPPVEYWEQVAICESSKDGHTADWQDKGTWSGGLGIYIGTWVRWGGRNFAPTPWKATKLEQIVVANRIAVTGYHFFTYSKNPVGFMGWGCIEKRKSLKPTPKVWNTYRTQSPNGSGLGSLWEHLKPVGSTKGQGVLMGTGTSLR